MKKGILVIIAMIMFSMFLFGKSVGKSKSMRPVDMGLSVKWASYNLGASSPEDYGNYFAWGETAAIVKATPSQDCRSRNRRTDPASRNRCSHRHPHSHDTPRRKHSAGTS